ncbi:CheR family methyltransferase [Paracoccus aestuariivivens]|uniref:Protein-glutamate O-methyltransferase CheR n=1 Tax=Paracoccus aestuariivivens TaxID=1820333 RepID=A0A6L6JCH7_9RHOB|nr:protein-glutamate O-methyltransferase CheR [Paracoccus aestuariivivens]MTH79206.1 protein-glutamate O-methyltransferase CheR [Paracoccus aestuariivivens]
MDAEVSAFADAVFERHGYDFRGYRHGALANRLHNLCAKLQLDSIPDLTEWTLRHPDRIRFVVDQITVPVTDLFREPETFAEVKRYVFPMLTSFSTLTIWHAGCSSGQEVYSLAILLHEAGLYARSRIFASDISGEMLRMAARGHVPADQVEDAEKRYRQSGGAQNLTSYFSKSGDTARIDPAMISNITFIEHNLATDGVFCEANLIFCRNVLIYFDRALQNRALGLFSDSLIRGGYLCLGSREKPVGTGATFVREQGCNLVYRPVTKARAQIGGLYDAGIAHRDRSGST